MTQSRTTAYPPSGQGGTPTTQDMRAAAEQGKQAGAEVAQTAADKAKQVAGEATTQARDLMGQARTQVSDQASNQHHALVDKLHAVDAELTRMCQSTDEPGLATELVAQARGRLQDVTRWLEQRQPGDLVDELRRFGREHPGTFLLGAVAAGVAAGRLTRGVVDTHSGDQHKVQSPQPVAPTPGTLP